MLGEDQALLEDVAREPSLPRVAVRAERTRLLEGLKVADFSWVGAGPLISKDLANLGAQVLRVESENHVDPLRHIPPFLDGRPDVSNGFAMANINQSKTGARRRPRHRGRPRAGPCAWSTGPTW